MRERAHAGSSVAGSTRRQLGVVVVCVLILAAVGPAARPAVAQPFAAGALTCTTRASAITCTLLIGPLTAAFPAGESIGIRVHGAAELGAVPPVVISAGPSPCTAAISPASVTPTSFRVTLGSGSDGCGAGASITIAETFMTTAAGGGPLAHTLSSFHFFPTLITAITSDGGAFSVPDMFGGSVVVCSSGGGAMASFVCTLTIGPLIFLAAGETVTVSLTSPGGVGTRAQAVFRTGEVTRAGGGCPATPPMGVTDSAFFVTTTDACSGFEVIVIAETLTAAGSGGGALCQTMTRSGSAPVTVCAVTPEGASFALPAIVMTPADMTAVCTPASGSGPARIGEPLSCVVTVSPVGGVQPGRATVALTNASFDQAGGARKDFACGDATAGSPCRSFTVVLFPTTACVALTQTIAFGGLSFAPPMVGPSGVPISVLPASGDCAAAAAPVSVTSVCVPAAGDVTDPVRQARPGTPITCVVSAGFRSAPAAGIAATVTLTGATFPGGATTATFLCTPSTAGSVATGGCTFNETFAATTACLPPMQTVTLLGATFTPAISTAAGALIDILAARGSGGLCARPVGGFVQPPGPRISCSSSAGMATQLDERGIAPLPSRISGVLVIAAAVLPEAVVCRVDVTVHRQEPAAENSATSPRATTRRLAVAPGTIEVSSGTATLLDAAGRPATRLRLGCDGATDIEFDAETESAVIDANTCRGARFSVAGSGVGIVDLRVRYGPAAAAAAAGIRPVESTAGVAFVAPTIDIAVAMSTTFTVPGVAGSITAVLSVAGLPCVKATCIDPVTGQPIAVRPGSVLSGSVIFAMDNPGVAAWTGAGPGGTVAAGQAVVRCGRPASRSTGPFAAFFRGCAGVSATFRTTAVGVTDITATFVPDLPGATGAGPDAIAPASSAAPLTGLFGRAVRPSALETLEVVDFLP